jgi:hypothetical protein
MPLARSLLFPAVAIAGNTAGNTQTQAFAVYSRQSQSG